MSKTLTSLISLFTFVWLLLTLAGCSQIPPEEINIAELYKDEVIHDIASLKEPDGLPPVRIITADGYFKYTDPEETFSLIFNNFPWEKDGDIIGAFEIERSLDPMISLPHAYVAYFKSESPSQFTDEYIEELADLMVNPDRFGANYEVVPFNTNGVKGIEYRYLNQHPEIRTLVIYAKVRTVVNDDYLYLYRLLGTEDQIFGVEADKFFGSFELLSN